MSIDASIPLAVNPPATVDVAQTMGRGLALRQAFEQAKQDAQARADDQVVRQTLSQSGGNLDTAIQQLYARGQAPAALKLQGVKIAQQKATEESLKLHFENEDSRYKSIARDIGTITDQSSQDALLSKYDQSDPQTAPLLHRVLGTTYDPTRVSQGTTIASTASEASTMKAQAAAAYASSSKTDEDQSKYLTTILANTPQDHWATVLQNATKLYRPEVVQDVQSRVQTPEQAKALALGPQKESTDKGGQHVEGMYQGRRTFGVFDPNTNTYNVDGKTVSAKDFTPIPPASLIIHNQGGPTPAPNATIEDLAKGSGYSVDGLKKAARAYHESGNLPALGMGSGKAKQAIQNAEALLYGAEGDLAMSGADFKAKAAALGSMTKQLAAVKAYEGTGLANLKMFTDLAKNIPDTGVPWLNTPLRSLSANVAGSENMAAINAARQVALTEISKVVNNPNLTGSLSDSAREEVLGLIPENATFGQILHVAKVLQKDMSQRPANIQKQIANLRFEMSHPGESAPEETPQQTSGGAAPNLVQQALKDKPPNSPGHAYKLSDGSRWVKKADGSVEKAQ